MSTLVSFEVAKYLESNFYSEIFNSIGCESYYDDDKQECWLTHLEDFGDVRKTCQNYILAPTIEDVVDWLFSMHNIFINIHIGYGYLAWFSYYIQGANKENESLFISTEEETGDQSWDTPKEALNMGVLRALKLVKNNTYKTS